MLIYWALFVVLASGALLDADGRFGRSRPAYLLLAALPTILMIGLRWNIGPDWKSYKAIFESTRLFNFGQAITRSDAGFYTLNWALGQLDAPFWVLNFACGTVFTIGLTAFCGRQPNPWLAFLVAFPYLVIVIAMSALRQSVALGFLFLALNAYEDGRLNRFLILALIAAAFHGSALLMIPLCLLSYSKSNRVVEVEDDGFSGRGEEAFINRGPDQRSLAVNDDRVIVTRAGQQRRSPNKAEQRPHRFADDMAALVEEVGQRRGFERLQIQMDVMLGGESGRPLLETVALAWSASRRLARKNQETPLTRHWQACDKPHRIARSRSADRTSHGWPLATSPCPGGASPTRRAPCRKRPGRTG